jgi:mannose-6-phosphate isomerase-like protein (cupin superfamily)
MFKMAEENVRPWGRYDILLQRENHLWVKRITVDPDQSLSLQYHNGRDEDWVIMEGSGIVRIMGIEHTVSTGDSFYIPRGSVHRISAGEDGISFLEIATGNVDEEDIIRIEDRYGRAE